MRLGTWNVEYAAGAEKNRRRLAVLSSMTCDVWVLTETHDDLYLGDSFHSVQSVQRCTSRARGRWVTIWSRFPIERVEVGDESRTAAAMVAAPSGPLLVFGTVLPWQSDRGPDGTARGWSEHHRVIPIQAAEWKALRVAHNGVAMCVAGDLNMNLGGTHYYGTARGRELLRAGLRDAGLVCVTETDRVPPAILAHAPIDHVCLSTPLATGARVVAAWEGIDADGVKLSDHSGLVVEVVPKSG